MSVGVLSTGGEEEEDDDMEGESADVPSPPLLTGMTRPGMGIHVEREGLCSVCMSSEEGRTVLCVHE